jgi:hypothetical protein
MIAMDLLNQHSDFNSKSPENRFTVSLAEHFNSVDVDFSENPNLLLEIEELRDVVGLTSSLQAGLLVNQDQSCWITNLGRNGSTEVYRPANKTYRKLANNQVAYLRHGDFVGFYGAFYRVEIRETKLSLFPIESRKTPKLAS